MAVEHFHMGRKTLLALCDALGITEKHVTHLVIEADIKNVATITATMLMYAERSDKISEVVKRFTVTEIKPYGIQAAIDNAPLILSPMENEKTQEPASEPKPRFREFT